MSYFKIIEAEATTNFAPNPAWRLDANFAAEAGTTVARSTTYAKYDVYSLRVQCDAGNEGVEITLSALANAIHHVTMRIAGILPDAWGWSLDDATFNVPTLVTETIDSTWSIYECNFPAIEASASVKLSIHQNGAGNGDFYIDGVQVEAKDGYYTTYCDGEQEGCEWSGAVNASKSSRGAVSLAGGRIRDLQDDYGFYVERMVSIGTGPIALSTDSYAVLPGGYVSNEKDEVREFILAGKVWDTSLANLHAGRQDLTKVFRPRVPGNQAIALRYTGAAVQKEIKAYYVDGLDGDIQAVNTQIGAYENVNVRFVAVDPYWYEIGESAAVLDVQDSITMRYIAGRLKSTGQWDDLGLTANPATGGTVYAICIASDKSVYVGGAFTNWNGNDASDNIVRYIPGTDTWEPLSTGLNSTVWDIIEGPNGDIYICGEFTDGVGDEDFIVRWDGTDFNALGDPTTGATITAAYAMAFDRSGYLYVVGNFTEWGNVAAADYIARWSGAAWTAVGAGGTGIVRTIGIDNDDNIYIGGDFQDWAADADADYLAWWNGSAWTSVDGAEVEDVVRAIAVSSDNIVYIGGAFTDINGDNTLAYVAAWDGSSFTSLNNTAMTTGLPVYSIAIAPNGRLGIGGNSLLVIWPGYSFYLTDMSGTSGGAIIHTIAFGERDAVIRSNFDMYVGRSTNSAIDIAGLKTVTNGGTAEAYPLISVTAATSGYIRQIRNETTGRLLYINTHLNPGEKLIIDLAPDKKTIMSSFYGPTPSAISAYSDFASFSLIPGDNRISVYAIESDTVVVFKYRTVYNGLD